MKIALVNINSRDRRHAHELTSRLRDVGYIAKATYEDMSISRLLATAKSIKADVIVCSREGTLVNLVSGKCNLEDWRGSRINLSIPVLIISPLSHVYSTATGAKLLDLDIKKLRHFHKPTYRYRYEIVECGDKKHLDRVEAISSLASCLVVDIETTKHNEIESIAITCLQGWEIGETFSIDLRSHSSYAHKVVHGIMQMPMPKAFHNGTFDTYQLLRYNIPVYNYTLDTEYMFWSWHVEMKKSLGYISSVLLDDYYFWKDEHGEDLLGYNAKDTINTARCLIVMMQQMPTWALKNYSKVISLAPVAVACGFEGFLVDKEIHKVAHAKAKEELAEELERLRVMLHHPTFNPGSWQQIEFVIYTLYGAKKPRAKSKSATDKVSLKKVALQHPILAKVIAAILGYRDNAKKVGTYYGADLFNDRILYSIKIDGTDTSRLASSKAALWAPLPEGVTAESKRKNYGAQIQNMPGYFKTCLMADLGYTLLNIDKSQSEARCTAYLAECEALRAALEEPPTEQQLIQYRDGLQEKALEGELIERHVWESAAGDFYCRCAYMFFGLIIDKSDPVRQITKKIIHGTNYMMGAGTFIDSVGIPELRKAQALLGDTSPSLNVFAGYLLSLYREAYPEVPVWWDDMAKDVAATGYIDTPDGWRREVLGNPVADASVQRSLVAHQPQHFSVDAINSSMTTILFRVQFPSRGKFRLKAQVHDSLTSQVVDDMIDYYANEMLKYMDIPQPTNFGILRIPLDVEVGKYWKPMIEWEGERTYEQER